MFDDGEDLEKGRLSIHSALGKAVCSCDAGDEIEFRDGTNDRKILIESVERSLTLEAPAEFDVSVDDTPAFAAAVG